jgi:hypothetical protein
MNDFTLNYTNFQLSSTISLCADHHEVTSEGSALGRDLTPNKQSYIKKRYIVFLDKLTGKVITVDTVKARYDRMRKRIKSWADVIGEIPGSRLVMVGLTYRPGDEYHPNHIRDFMSRVKRKLGDGLLGYAWVSELQERGALHYHVCMYLRKGTRFPLPDKAGWWPHGASKVVTAKSPYYMLSYTKKKYQKDYDKFPLGCHAFAVWIREDIMAEKLRYLSLKDWEKGVIDSDGWESLPFYRQMKKDCSHWQMEGCYSSLEVAERQTEYWLDLFEKLKPKIPSEDSARDVLKIL